MYICIMYKVIGKIRKNKKTATGYHFMSGNESIFTTSPIIMYEVPDQFELLRLVEKLSYPDFKWLKIKINKK